MGKWRKWPKLSAGRSRAGGGSTPRSNSVSFTAATWLFKEETRSFMFFSLHWTSTRISNCELRRSERRDSMCTTLMPLDWTQLIDDSTDDSTDDSMIAMDPPERLWGPVLILPVDPWERRSSSWSWSTSCSPLWELWPRVLPLLTDLWGSTGHQPFDRARGPGGLYPIHSWWNNPIRPDGAAASKWSVDGCWPLILIDASPTSLIGQISAVMTSRTRCTALPVVSRFSLANRRRRRADTYETNWKLGRKKKIKHWLIA